MNITERKALKWILKQGYSESEVVFRSRETPDFLTSDGKTFEAKRVYGKNKVWIYGTQVQKLIDTKAIILAFDEDAEPKVILPAGDLKDGNIYNGVRFVEIDNTSDTAIVIRDLTTKEKDDLHVLKAELGERTWRTLLLRVTSFFRKSLTKNGETK